MNQSDLARKLGLTRQAISKLKRKGMPIDSIEAANQWRLVHAPPRKTHVAAEGDKAETPFAAAVTRAQRAKAVEQFLFDTMQKAAEAQDIRLTAKVSKDFLTAMKRAIECEQQAVAAGVQTRELIRAQDIEKEFFDVVQPFLHRCEQAERDPKNCGWYVTLNDVAEETRKTLQFFFRRLTPRDLFNETPQPQTH